MQPTQASNYLGHFYLTHLLLDKLSETPQSRIVNLTSLVEPNGSIEWTDIGYAFFSPQIEYDASTHVSNIC